jgi:transcription antitermination factor NusG
MPILKREPDTFPETLFEMDDPWRVAHLRSRQEKAFSRYLRDYDIAYYLPQMEKRIRRGGRTITSYIPLFGGYVFFRGMKDAIARALRSNVVVNILEPPDQPQMNSELLQLHRLQLTDGRLTPHAYIGPGDTVLITDGAFQGYRGVVVREKGVERLVVSVSFIRQSVCLEIDREFIRPDRRPAATFDHR